EEKKSFTKNSLLKKKKEKQLIYHTKLKNLHSMFLSNLIHPPTMLLNLLNIRTHSTQVTPLNHQTAYVQFHKSNRKKEEFIGSLRFFRNDAKNSGTIKTVAYGQWHNIHDT